MRKFYFVFITLLTLALIGAGGIVRAQTDLGEITPTVIPDDPEPPTGEVTVDANGGQVSAQSTFGLLTSNPQLPHVYGGTSDWIAGRTITHIDCSRTSDCSKYRVRVLLCKQDLNGVKDCGDQDALRGDQQSDLWNVHTSQLAPCVHSGEFFFFTKAQFQVQHNSGWDNIGVARSDKGSMWLNCTIQ